MKKQFSYIFYCFIVMWTLQACSTAKYVTDDQTLLASNDINFNKDIEVKNKILLETELSSFIKQRPNGSLFWFIPREWFYFKNSEPADTCWYNNWGRNSIGEEPTFFDLNMARESASDMQKYLRNTKGFYQAEVDLEVEEKGHKTNVKYNIQSGKRLHVKSIDYIGRDSNIVKILDQEKENSLIKVGDPLDALTFQKEKSRMITAIQDRGYANFLTNNLKLYGDSTDQENTVEVFYQVLPPLPDSIHHRYKIGDIHVYTDYYNEQNPLSTISDTVDNVIFHREAKDWIVSPDVLLSKIYLKSGDWWTSSGKSNTFRKLSDLTVYRFVSINNNLNAKNDSLINYNIYLTPVKSKYVLESGVDLNYSAVNTITGRQLFGVSGNALINVRNLFGGSEDYTFSIDNGYEFNLDTFGIRTFSLGVNNALEIPKFMDLLGSVKFLNLTRLISGDRYQDIKEETTTTFNLGLNYTAIRDFYTINSINASVVNNYNISQRFRIVFKPTNFSLNTADLQPRFIDQFNNNQNIINTFQDNLITGYLFNEIGLVYNSAPSASGSSYTLIGNFEASGWETEIFNKILDPGNDWTFFQDVEFAKFLKAEFDGRYYQRITSNSELAFRFNAGVAVPYGGSKAVPFIRQFSVGGPNSLRGWNQKELGPGGNREFLENEENGDIFFQQGDIKLEFNAEYRFQIFWLLEGAFFADIGNIWTIDADDTRENTQFTRNFYDQLAMAAGWGMRWDFEYFNIRFDFAYRLRNPFPDDETGSAWYTWDGIRDQGLGNLQVAVNYPF